MIDLFNSISVLANRIFDNLINGTDIALYTSGADPFTAAIIQFIIVTAISYIIAPKPKAPTRPSQGSGGEIQGTLVNKDSNNNPIPVL